MVDVIIVGGGASGLVCGIEAAGRGRRCLILEQKEKAGKKLYATGNGRCNFANRHVSLSCYHSVCEETEPEIGRIITPKSCRETEEFFRKLGIPAVERDDYLYPRSGQAGALVHALEQAYREYGGELRCNETVKDIVWLGEHEIRVTTQNQSYYGKRLVLATGGMASPNLGSDGSGYQLARHIGHTVTTCLPALCGLTCKEPGWNRLQGVRTKGMAALWRDGVLLCRDSGEIQFTGYGVSGIVIFNLSRYAGIELEHGNPVTLLMDFFPEYTKEALTEQLKQMQKVCGYRTLLSVWSGYLPDKLAGYLLGRLGIPDTLPIAAVTLKQLKALAALGKSFSISITGEKGFSEAQVTAGGIPLKEIQLDTMESKIRPGCYLLGELLDVDGCCGGYNLLWAWETGRRAGSQI